MTSRVFSIISVSLLVAACSGGSTDQLAQSVGGQSKRIGAEGGQLSTDRGVLEVPAGALTQNREIVVTPLDDSELPAGALPGTGVELGPDGLQFEQAVQLTLRYDANDLDTDTRWVRIAQVRPDGTLGATQLIKNDAGGQQVTAGLVHFSRYAVVDLKKAEALIDTTNKDAKQVDVLFVIDESPSMIGEQKSLAENFPRFIAALDQAQLDYRVGVISSSMGAEPFGKYFGSGPGCGEHSNRGGKLQDQPWDDGCTPAEDPWIEHRADGSTNAPDDDVAAAFGCIAQLGDKGCGFEQPLEAVHQALDPQVNPGFLRQDAALALVFITDEDDCSAADPGLFDPSSEAIAELGALHSFRCFQHGVVCDQAGTDVGPRTGCKPATEGYLHPIERYVRAVERVRPDGNVFVANIAGPNDPIEIEMRDIDPMGNQGPSVALSCKRTASGSESDSAAAYPSVRLTAFADAFGPQRSDFTNICEPDLSPALAKLGQMTAKAHRLAWCLPYDPEDTNPLTDQLDADCEVDLGDSLADLPACDGADDDQPCFRLIDQPACPDSSTLLELTNVQPDQVQDQAQVQCLVP